jgi:hypothetical protein
MFIALTCLVASQELNSMFMNYGTVDGKTVFIPSTRMRLVEDALAIMRKFPRHIQIEGSKKVLERLIKMFPEHVEKPEANVPTVVAIVGTAFLTGAAAQLGKRAVDGLIDAAGKIHWVKSEDYHPSGDYIYDYLNKKYTTFRWNEDGVEQTVYVTEVDTPYGLIYLPTNTKGKFDNLEMQIIDGITKIQ